MNEWALTEIFPTPKIYVCFSNKEQRAALKKEKIKIPINDLSGVDGKTVHYQDENGNNVILVCFPELFERSSSTCALFAHEAVHVAQDWCDIMKEDQPGREIMAYMVQAATQVIIDEYLDRLKKREK